MTVPVTENHHWVLTKKRKFGLPHFAMPPFMNNKGCYTVSLGSLTRWLAGQAEALGVEIFPGFAAAEVRSEEHTSELQSLMRISYAVFCLKKKNTHKYIIH